MAYATQADVEKILPDGETVPGAAEDKLATMLEEASDLIIGYLGFEYTGTPDILDGVPDDVPGAVRRVAARVALRTFIDEPDEPGAASTRDLMGPFSHDINWSKESQDGSVYLSPGERMRLEPFLKGSIVGAAHYPMYGAGDLNQPFYAARSGGWLSDTGAWYLHQPGWWPSYGH